MYFNKKTITILFGVIVLIFTSVGVYAAATQPDFSGQTIYACVKDNGQLRLTNGSTSCDKNEQMVSWNVVGPQGIPGPAGPQGPAGKDGVDGKDGAAGPVGPQGPAGKDGVDGKDGAVGPVGPQGPKGATGEQGPAGSVGATGPQGPKGDTGDTGPMGLQGSVGPQGPNGDTGPAGLAGPAGPQGPQGPAGPQGPSGVMEIVGLSGFVSPIPGNSNVFVFVGPQVTVTTTTDVNRVTAVVQAALGLNSGGPLNFDYSLCTQPASGGPLLDRAVYTIGEVSTNRSSFTATGSFTLPAGTYKVGMCARNGNGSAINDTDWAQGWVMLTKNTPLTATSEPAAKLEPAVLSNEQQR